MDKDTGDKTRTHLVLAPDMMVQHYRIIEKIGAGGMGEVYLAEDTKLGRKVALKFLPSEFVSSEESKARFYREAQAVARLNHPNIVTIHDVSEFSQRPFFVMEHIEGNSLHHFAHEEPLPFDIIVEYAIQISLGLAEAHRAGIVHRDVKAANVVIDKQGRARLLDFGLAALEGDDKLTKTGSTLGTVAYMSPEQVAGRKLDHRTDLFSLGSVLYELIAGRTPFRRDNEGATLRAIVEEPPEPLSRYKAGVPEALQNIVFKLLEKDSELRYQSAEGVIADLKRLMYDSRPSSVIAAPKKKSKLLPLAIGGLIIFMLGFAAVLTIMLDNAGSAADAEGKMPMIAVLPFENVGSSEDDYFADGMTDEITSRLAGIKGLGVISRTSAMKYKDSDLSLAKIGKALGVDYVLLGSVRWSKAGDNPRVRITPQLVRVKDDRQLWADNYDRQLMGVFEVQAEIATMIVNELDVTLLENDRENLSVQYTENPRAYEFYLKGLNAYRFREENLTGMMEMKANLDSAVALDPGFAQAHAMRSKAYSYLSFGLGRLDEFAATARQEAERALELQPGSPDGHTALGIYYNLVETDYKRALQEFNLAKSEVHNDPELLEGIALVQMRQGNFAEATENFRKATDLDPLNPTRHYELAECLYFNRAFAEAERSNARALALAPDRAFLHWQKLRFNASRYGDPELLATIVHEGFDQVDSLTFISGVWWMAPFMPELDWDSLLRRFESEPQPDIERHVYYASLGTAGRVLGDTATMLAYADLARIELEAKLAETPDDPHFNVGVGICNAVLGNCERAFEYGERGVSLMTVDDCHW